LHLKVQRLLLLFLIGAIVGSLLDAFHVYSSIEQYPMPAFIGLAWWVPLLFGGAVVAIGYSHPLVDPLLHNRRPPKSIVSSAAESGWIVLAYLISASTLDSRVKTGFLCIIYLNFWLLAGTGWQNLLLSLVTAITGTLVEMVLVAGGAFSYLHPDFIGVPYWLPCIYACASLAVGDLGRSLLTPATRG
jgi:hypothetical protein